MIPPRTITSRLRTAFIGLFCLAAAQLTNSQRVLAQDVDDPQPPAAQPDQPAPPPEDRPPSDHPDEIINETIRLMQQAQNRLADSVLDDDTSRLHDQILANLEDLLKQAGERAAQRVDVSLGDEPDPDGQQTDTSGEEAAGDPDRNRQAPSDGGESSEGSRNGNAPDEGDVQQRLDLATSVWGHYPPRTRDRMRGAFSERFLPAYDELVRRYYEALATDGDVLPPSRPSERAPMDDR